tara:strand:+ start:82 stop:498 length:417 start_codon:yes stop_codon:yes gene_type:complete
MSDTPHCSVCLFQEDDMDSCWSHCPTNAKDFGQPTFTFHNNVFQPIIDAVNEMTDEEREALLQSHIDTDKMMQAEEDKKAQEERERILTTGNYVWMIGVPYEGHHEPAFATEEACREHWADMMSVDSGAKVCLIEVIE